MTDDKFEDAKTKFDREVEIHDDPLKAKNRDEFKAWMDTMISGIVCFATDCNAEICEKENSPEHSARHRSAAQQTAERRKEMISKWRESWQTDEFQEWIDDLKPNSRVTRRDNFRYLAKHFKRGEWIKLVSVADTAGGGGVPRELTAIVWLSQSREFSSHIIS
jgi:translation elongation factor EF-G